MTVPPVPQPPAAALNGSRPVPHHTARPPRRDPGSGVAPPATRNPRRVKDTREYLDGFRRQLAGIRRRATVNNEALTRLTRAAAAAGRPCPMSADEIEDYSVLGELAALAGEIEDTMGVIARYWVRARLEAEAAYRAAKKAGGSPDPADRLKGAGWSDIGSELGYEMPRQSAYYRFGFRHELPGEQQELAADLARVLDDKMTALTPLEGS